MRSHRKLYFGLIIVVIVMCSGSMKALAGTAQAGQLGKTLPLYASRLPDLSGLAWVEDDHFLAVHDAKNPEEIERPRMSMIQLPAGLDGIRWKKQNVRFPGGKSNDFESAARIPGTRKVLLVESTEEQDEKPFFRRIFLADFFHQRLRIVDVIDWSTATTNVEGTAVARIDDRLIFVYAERAEGLPSTDIKFADLELEPLNIDNFRKAGTFTNPDFPRTNRPVTAMEVDSGGTLYAASAFDPGNDNGPFRSVVWEVGRIILNNETDKLELALDPAQLAILNGFKVESVAVREQDGSGWELFVGLDDENYGGTMRPLQLGPYGWAVGEAVDGYGVIIHTTDGGQTWVRQGTAEEIPDMDLINVAAIDAQNAWVVGGSADGYGVILRTRNGGRTWERQGSPDELAGYSTWGVYALDRKTAWVTGSPGLILHTTDGGRTWTRQEQDVAPDAELSGIYANDANHIWVVGPNDPTNGVILHTEDGGANWHKVYHPCEEDWNCGYPIWPHGVNDNMVWISGNSVVMHTTDGGTTWIDQTPPAGGPMDDYNGLFVVDSNTIWTVLDPELIFRSDDGGATWDDPMYEDKSQRWMRISAVDSQTAWVVGRLYSHGDPPGKVLFTEDGGKTWTIQTTPVQTEWGGVSFVR